MGCKATLMVFETLGNPKQNPEMAPSALLYKLYIWVEMRLLSLHGSVKGVDYPLIRAISPT